MIHMIWIGSRVPPHVVDVVDAWRTMHPDTDLKLWTSIPDELMSEHHTLIELAPNPQSQADVLRYWLMFKYGGIYADVDCLPRNPCMGLLATHADFAADVAPYRGAYDNYFIGASGPGHQVWADTLGRCYRGSPDFQVMPYHFRSLWRRDGCPMDLVPTACPDILTGDEWVVHTPTWRPQEKRIPYPGPSPEQRIITEEEEQFRLETCNKCEYLMNNGVCKKCGCSGRNTSRLADVHCPINKW